MFAFIFSNMAMQTCPIIDIEDNIVWRRRTEDYIIGSLCNINKVHNRDSNGQTYRYGYSII